MKFNINDYVKIKLTEYGHYIYKKKITDLGLNPDVYHKMDITDQTDADGWTRMQLWCVMSNFGDVCYNGNTLPFSTQIDILENK